MELKDPKVLEERRGRKESVVTMVPTVSMDLQELRDLRESQESRVCSSASHNHGLPYPPLLC